VLTEWGCLFEQSAQVAPRRLIFWEQISQRVRGGMRGRPALSYPHGAAVTQLGRGAGGGQDL
jgi:hypothetical protein